MSEPTLADVAEAAGVSIATASRVLSGARFVSEDKARAVRKAITALGYRHNAVASALRNQRTETVGLILPKYSTGFLSALIESVSAALDAAQLSLVLRYTSEGGAGDADSVGSLLARRVDGLIICPPSEAVSHDAVAAAGRVPVIQVGRYIVGDATDSVGLDDQRATHLVLTRLADFGSKRLVSVGLSNDVEADARRIAALRVACAAHGVEFVDAIPVGAVLGGGVDAAKRILAESGGGRVLRWNGSDVDTLVCANDDVAHGLLAVLELNGLDVPGRVQVASLLDVSFEEDDVRQVTTLRHPWEAMGRESVRLLLDVLTAPRRADEGTRRVGFAPTLLLGRSSR